MLQSAAVPAIVSPRRLGRGRHRLTLENAGGEEVPVGGAQGRGRWSLVAARGAGRVAGQGGHDRADLLVAGGQQEGGGAAVALHPHDHIARFWVGELGDAVGGHGAAGVHVGVDDRAEGGRALQGRLQRQAQLGGDGVVGPEPGGRDHRIGLHDQVLGLDDLVALDVVAGQPDPVTGQRDGADAKAADQLDAAVLDQGGQVGGEPAPGREFVGLGAALADQWPGGGRADRPHDLGARRLLLELGQGEQAGRSRMAGPDHHRPPSGIAVTVAAEDVGQPVGDPGAGVGLAQGGEPGGAQGVGLGPGPRGVDHRPRLQVTELVLVVADPDLEWELVAARAADLVQVLSGDRDHLGVQVDAAGEGGDGGQRLQVVLEQVGAGGQGVRVRAGPAGLLEQAHADRVQGQAPGGEQPHVPPLGDVGPDLRARLEDEGLQAPVEQVGSGGQPDRAGPNDHHRQAGAGAGGGVGVLDREAVDAVVARHRMLLEHVDRQPSM